MRLTEKYDDGYYNGYYTTGKMSSGIAYYDQEKFTNAAIEKLGELEDIEEEFGLDLMQFSKVLFALNNGYVFVKTRKKEKHDGYSLLVETGAIEKRSIVRFDRYINGTRDWFIETLFYDEDSVGQYYIKDYGKTWGLEKDFVKEEKE